MRSRTRSNHVRGLALAVALSGCSAQVVQNTPTPSERPPPPATPLPTPTPTPSPAANLAGGEAALLKGDWEAALGPFGAAADWGEGGVAEQGVLGRTRLLIESGRAEE